MSPKMSVMQCKKQFHVILFYATFAYIRKKPLISPDFTRLQVFTQITV